MTDVDRRLSADRRGAPRGGRRAGDRAGAYPSVLVADSYDGARQPVVRYLQRFHFSVHEAADGEAALQKIVTAAPHVIVADSALPTLPARRLFHWLEQSRPTRAVPLIVLVNEYDPDEGIPPAAAVLVKPFSLASMLDEVRRVLRTQQHLRD
jgi:CheY-like chemotaxis protein